MHLTAFAPCARFHTPIEQVRCRWASRPEARRPTGKDRFSPALSRNCSPDPLGGARIPGCAFRSMTPSRKGVSSERRQAAQRNPVAEMGFSFLAGGKVCKTLVI